jgi:cytochrome c nitrite reductase small subunit
MIKPPEWFLALLRRYGAVFVAGAVFASVSLIGTEMLLSFSSETSFCMSCHEMRVVGEQGWMHSSHYRDHGGVVTQCRDCHIPPEPLPRLWVKSRDGLKDVYTHFLGESDPQKMDWVELGESARRKIWDSSCLRCHEDLTPRGATIKALVAHREYIRTDGAKKCLECHTEPFHTRHRDMIRRTHSGHVEREEP